MFGKQIRLNRIRDKKTKNYLLVPMDHGITLGPIKGIRNIEDTVESIAANGGTGVIVHKGIVGRIVVSLGEMGLLIHISASTQVSPLPNSKVLVSDLPEVVSLGADAVSVQINLGADTEAEMLSDIGYISGEARKFGMPLLVMAYPRGDKIKDSFDEKYVSHAVRVAEELGADVIKTSYTGDVKSFRDVVSSVSKPVLIAGGERIDSDMKLLNMVYESVEAGGKGVSIGRNVFQHEKVGAMVKAIDSILNDNFSPEDAMQFLG